jgi:hypothetical protein
MAELLKECAHYHASRKGLGLGSSQPISIGLLDLDFQIQHQFSMQKKRFFSSHFDWIPDLICLSLNRLQYLASRSPSCTGAYRYRYAMGSRIESE